VVAGEVGELTLGEAEVVEHSLGDDAELPAAVASSRSRCARGETSARSTTASGSTASMSSPPTNVSLRPCRT
jgi:hypothetical protein